MHLVCFLSHHTSECELIRFIIYYPLAQDTQAHTHGSIVNCDIYQHGSHVSALFSLWFILYVFCAFVYRPTEHMLLIVKVLYSALLIFPIFFIAHNVLIYVESGTIIIVRKIRNQPWAREVMDYGQTLANSSTLTMEFDYYFRLKFSLHLFNSSIEKESLNKRQLTKFTCVYNETYP